MATATAKRPSARKPATALVFNPTRKLNIATSNPVKRKKRTHRRNPVTKTVSARSHRIRKNPGVRKNPGTFSSLLMASLFAGAGVSLFDMIVDQFAPNASGLYKVGIKGGLAWLMQSQTGRSIPVLGRYANEIALFFGISAAVDLINTFAIPQAKKLINQYLPSTTDSTALTTTTGQTSTAATTGTTAPLSGVRGGGLMQPVWKPGYQR